MSHMLLVLFSDCIACNLFNLLKSCKCRHSSLDFSPCGFIAKNIYIMLIWHACDNSLTFETGLDKRNSLNVFQLCTASFNFVRILLTFNINLRCY